MKAKEFLKEAKKVEPSKPRNFVAKNSKMGMGGAGAHKDKKKAAKQGDVKHKKKDVELSEANTDEIKRLEGVLSNLERLMPTVEKVSKENHYVFEDIESQVSMLLQSIEEIGDESAMFDLKSEVESAVERIRQANGAVYSIEKTLKSLIRSTQYAIEDAQDENEFESRFGGLEESSHGKYWCSTDKKWKYRKGPKQTRSSK